MADAAALVLAGMLRKEMGPPKVMLFPERVGSKVWNVIKPLGTEQLSNVILVIVPVQSWTRIASLGEM